MTHAGRKVGKGTELVKFFRNGILFSAVLLLLVLLANHVYLESTLHNTVFYRKEVMYLQYINSIPKREIAYAFLGSSHTMDDVNPDFIEGAYNFGSGAESYFILYHKLCKILNHDKVSVKNIVLELDLSSFSQELNNKDEILYNWWFYVDYIPIHEASRVSRKNQANLWLLAKFPVFGEGERFSLGAGETAQLNKGWRLREGNYSLAAMSNEISAAAMDGYLKRQYLSDVYSPDETAMWYFTKILELVRENKIGVIFIKYPITGEFRRALELSNISSQAVYAPIYAAIDSSLGSNYTVLDYQDMFVNDSGKFAYDYHLNYAGAQILSEKIAQDISNLSTRSSD